MQHLQEWTAFFCATSINVECYRFEKMYKLAFVNMMHPSPSDYLVAQLLAPAVCAKVICVHVCQGK